MSPTIFRIFALILQIIVFIIVIIIFKPNRNKLKSAFFAGIFCSIYDFIIEVLGYKYGAWYCYGGFQIYNVPIDMSIQFIFFGMMISILSDFPDLFRKWNFLKIFYENKKYDLFHKIIFLILLSLIGAVGDFISKRFGVWENANWWTFYHTAFIAWLSLNTLTLVVYNLIMRLTQGDFETS